MNWIDIFLLITMIMGAILFTCIGFKMGRAYPKECKHRYKVLYKTNGIRYEKPGYPERLCYCKCRRCGKEKLMWVDSIQCTDYTEDISKFVTIQYVGVKKE